MWLLLCVPDVMPGCGGGRGGRRERGEGDEFRDGSYMHAHVQCNRHFMHSMHAVVVRHTEHTNTHMHEHCHTHPYTPHTATHTHSPTLVAILIFTCTSGMVRTCINTVSCVMSVSVRLYEVWLVLNAGVRVGEEKRRWKERGAEHVNMQQYTLDLLCIHTLRSFRLSRRAKLSVGFRSIGDRHVEYTC